MEFKNAAEIWERVEKDLGYEIEPHIRRYFQRKRYISGIRSGNDTIKNLEKDVRLLLECLGDVQQPSPGTKRGQEGPDIVGDNRAQMQSKIWADEMNHASAVLEFRDEYLNGKTLQNSDGIDRWLDIQAFGEEQEYDDKQPWIFGPAWDSEWHKLDFEFYEPRQRIEFAERDNPDHKGLVQLRMLADRLSSKTPWSKGQATWFILTGQAPQMYMLGSTYLMQGGPGKEATIVMTILPRTSPDEVLKVYRELRRDLLIKERERDLSEKQVKLLQFVLDSLEKNQDWSYPELYREWNRLYPGDSKDTIYLFGNFVRDVKRAVNKVHATDVRRLLEPNVTHEEWERLRDESARIAAERAQQSGGAES